MLRSALHSARVPAVCTGVLFAISCQFPTRSVSSLEGCDEAGTQPAAAGSKQIQFRCLFPPTPAALPPPRQPRSLCGSILLISGVLSPAECALLRREADDMLDGGAYRRDRYCDGADDEGADEDDGEDDSSLRRLALCDMSADARALSDAIVMDRVLPELRRQVPVLCRELGVDVFDSPGVVFEWAADEPSVNRYVSGGKFDAHRDGYQLTVIILLSEAGAFTGGGTKFLEPDVDDGGASAGSIEAGVRRKRKSVLVQPPQGTAVLFDGDIAHSGSPVISGVRHLYVASFSIETESTANAG